MSFRTPTMRSRSVLIIVVVVTPYFALVRGLSITFDRVYYSCVCDSTLISPA